MQDFVFRIGAVSVSDLLLSSTWKKEQARNLITFLRFTEPLMLKPSADRKPTAHTLVRREQKYRRKTDTFQSSLRLAAI